MAGPRSRVDLGVATLIVAYGAVATGWQLLRPGDPPELVFAGLIDVPLSGVAVACALLAARRSPTAAGCRAWLLIGLAFAAFGLGDTAWCYLEAVLEVEPFPSIADVGYLAFYPLLLVGLLVLPREWPDSPTRTLLDLATVVVASGTVVWWLVLAPVATAATELESLIALAYPVGDLLLLFALAATLMSRLVGTSRAVLALLGIGIILNVIADLSYARLSLEDAYESGYWIDAAWTVGWMAMALAALSAARGIAEAPRPDAASVKTRPLSFIPYVAVAGLFGLLLGASGTEGNSPVVLVAGATVVTGLVMARQVFERRQFEARLRDQALRDPLTGLANRALFADRLDQALRHGRRGGAIPSLLYLDLDDFKVINDSLGHDVGDRVLVEVARRLALSIRSEDTAARLGGDEFAVLLGETRSEADAVAVAVRVLAALEPSIDVDRESIATGASIGIVRPETRESEPTDLLRDADVAMYAAKREARGSYRIFDPGTITPLNERAILGAGHRTGAESAPAGDGVLAAV